MRVQYLGQEMMRLYRLQYEVLKCFVPFKSGTHQILQQRQSQALVNNILMKMHSADLLNDNIIRQPQTEQLSLV